MNFNGFNNIPAFYDYVNAYDGTINPGVVHTNSTLKRYFMKYLLEKVMSIYEFENVPDDWNMSYMLYCLFCFGFITIFNTKEFGVIPQHCTLFGRGVFYQPTRCLVSNPLLQGMTKELKIGKECELIKLQPNYSGIMDIISYYADMLALCSESATVNLVNTKLAYVYIAENKAQAESFKKMHDQITSGNPAVFTDKKLYDEEGNPRWLVFNQNLKNTYISGDILLDMAKWLDMFNTEIGIPNANTEKKERMLTDEVNANNVDTMAKATLWMETLKDGFDKANKMFNLNINVKFRFKEQENNDASLDKEVEVIA